jgi:hypothetical protein
MGSKTKGMAQLAMSNGVLPQKKMRKFVLGELPQRSGHAGLAKSDLLRNF